ncbi:MAG: hypothetical protein ACREMB_24585 [Candidatus Rokuibacteriota bacterium]
MALVTTPNFSLFADQPCWDDLHSIKRIALVHEEFLSEGLPAALHINARTDQDWERWRAYVAVRPEVTHIAFEFATGAGRAERIKWYADGTRQTWGSTDSAQMGAGRGTSSRQRSCGRTVVPRGLTCFAGGR